MNIISRTLIVFAAFSIISTTFSTAAAGPLTAQREARMDKIEALYFAIRSGRMTRSAEIEARLQIARLEAEARKDRRQQDRIRDRQAALSH